MPALIDIRRRIRSVKSTQQVTKAMKMVSAAKLRRAQEAIFAARPFARKMLEVLNRMASRADPHAHPLLESPPGPLSALFGSLHEPADIKHLSHQSGRQLRNIFRTSAGKCSMHHHHGPLSESVFIF